MCALTAKYSHNLCVHCIVEISSILQNIYVVLRDQKKIVFYVNNYIDWDQFNQLYALNWLNKNIQNADTVTQKLTLGSTKIIDLKKKRLEKSKKWLTNKKQKL